MSAQRSSAYFVCPECRFAARQGPSPAWTTCPRCRARGERIELLVRQNLRASDDVRRAEGSTAREG
jgi:hypothetical protein